VVIVGAGLAGLCCGLHLQERGMRVLLLEANGEVGGRVRTDRVDGFLLDRGFQVLLTAYPEARAMLDLASLRLGHFAPGALIRTRDRFVRVADPFRRPGHAIGTLLSGVASPLDALRIARLRRRVGRGTPQALLDGVSSTTLDALRAEGFSQRIIERFFRPFLGGVLLDRELRASSRAFAFLFRMFAEGDASLPAQGMGAIPQQLSERLGPGTLRTRTRVARLEPSGVALTTGERIDARAVVVATAGASGGRLPRARRERLRPRERAVRSQRGGTDLRAARTHPGIGERARAHTLGRRGPGGGRTRAARGMVRTAGIHLASASDRPHSRRAARPASGTLRAR
jgi:phytoene dehydrogenase-like protein